MLEFNTFTIKIHSFQHNFTTFYFHMGYTITFVNGDSNYPENPGQFESNRYQDLGINRGKIQENPLWEN